VVVLVASLAVPPPTARALPRDYIIINYYDCSWNNVGYAYRDCAAHWSYGGSQSGFYRTTEQTECAGPPVSYTVEEWSTTTYTWQPWDGDMSDACCDYLHVC